MHPETSGPALTVDDLLMTDALQQSPARPPDYFGESRALGTERAAVAPALASAGVQVTYV
jgi:hypothetical protein